jgi:hypothetical protein
MIPDVCLALELSLSDSVTVTGGAASVLQWHAVLYQYNPCICRMTSVA